MDVNDTELAETSFLDTVSVPINKNSESPIAPSAVRPAIVNVGVVSLVKSSRLLTPESDASIRSTSKVPKFVAVLSNVTALPSVVAVTATPALAA